MAAEALVAPLLQLEIFRGLPPQFLAQIARIAERIVYREGDVIALSGAEADAAILIVSGAVVRTEGPAGSPCDEPVQTGSLVAEMAMLVETEHTSSIAARGQVRALRIPRVALYELMGEHPEVAEHFLAKLTARLHGLAAELRRIEQGLGRGWTPERSGVALSVGAALR